MPRPPFVLALATPAWRGVSEARIESAADSLGPGVEVPRPGPGETVIFEVRRARGSRGE